jgi:cbb3-type cytochrome oxidase subunit 3
MIKKNKFILAFLVIFLFFTFFNITGASYGLNETVNVGGLGQAFNVKGVDDASSSGNFISSRLGILIGAILSFIGVVFMVLIIYGGLMWMTARGNEQQVDKARDLIMQAVIGLIIVLAAYAVTAFIGEQLTSSGSTGTTSGGGTSKNILENISLYC